MSNEPKTLTYQGRTHTLTQWSEETGLSYFTLHRRLRNGWTTEQTLALPAERSRYVNKRSDRTMITFKGRTQSVHEWSAKIGTSVAALRSRLKKNWSIEEALTIPTIPRSRHQLHRGVGRDPTQIKETGACSFAHEAPEMDFSKEETLP